MVVQKFSEFSQVNEGILDFLKKFFGELKEMGTKVENSKEIDVIMETAKKDFDKLFKSKEAELKKMFEEKEKANTKPVAKTETTENKWDVKKFSLFEADVVKPQGTKIEDAVKTTPQDATAKKDETPLVNPVDKAIEDFLEEVKNNRMKKYIDSKIESVKYYALGKMSELNQYIINRKIELYKMQKGDFSKTLVEQETKKLEQSKSNYKVNMDKLKSIVKSAGAKLSKVVFTGTTNQKSTQAIVDKLRTLQSDKNILLDIRDNILGLSKTDFVIHDKDNKDTVEEILKELSNKDKTVLVKLRDKIGLDKNTTPL